MTMNGKLGGGNATGRLTDLDAAGLQVLQVLGWAEAGVLLRFFDNGRPGEAFMTVFAGERFVVPGVEALRRPGVSFVQDDALTLLEENGTAVHDEVVVSVAEYERDPGACFFGVMSAVLADPAAAVLLEGLRALKRRITPGVVMMTLRG